MNGEPSDEAASIGQVAFFRGMLSLAIVIYAVLTFFLIASVVEHWSGMNVAEGRDLLSIPAEVGLDAGSARYDSASP